VSEPETRGKGQVDKRGRQTYSSDISARGGIIEGRIREGRGVKG